MNFHHYESRLYELFGEGRIEDALDLVSSLPTEIRRASCFFDYAEANLRVMTGDAVGALRLLSEIAERGEWIHPRLLTEDPDFGVLSQEPIFADLCTRFAMRHGNASGPERPWEILEPETSIRGVVVVLHGSDSRAEHNLYHWVPAMELGWRVVLVTSPAVGRWAGAYDWPSYQIARTRVDEAIAATTGQPGSWETSVRWPGGSEATALEPGDLPVVLAGFSRGGEMAIRLALEGVGAARTVIAVAPAPIREPELLVPAPACHLDVAQIYSGGRDPQAECTDRAAARLEAGGVTCTVRRQAKLGHEYPPRFGEELGGIL